MVRGYFKYETEALQGIRSTVRYARDSILNVAVNLASEMMFITTLIGQGKPWRSGIRLRRIPR